jgi:hypothetical protein
LYLLGHFLVEIPVATPSGATKRTSVIPLPSPAIQKQQVNVLPTKVIPRPVLKRDRDDSVDTSSIAASNTFAPPAPPAEIKKVALICARTPYCSRPTTGSLFCSAECNQQAMEIAQVLVTRNQMINEAKRITDSERAAREKFCLLFETALKTFIIENDLKVQTLAKEIELAIYQRYAPEKAVLPSFPHMSKDLTKEGEQPEQNETNIVGNMPIYLIHKPLMGTPSEGPYRNQCRTILVSLRNPKLNLLRGKLSSGEWKPEQIVAMDAMQFSDDAVRELEKARAASLASVVRSQEDEGPLIRKTHKGEIAVTNVMARQQDIGRTIRDQSPSADRPLSDASPAVSVEGADLSSNHGNSLNSLQSSFSNEESNTEPTLPILEDDLSSRVVPESATSINSHVVSALLGDDDDDLESAGLKEIPTPMNYTDVEQHVPGSPSADILSDSASNLPHSIVDAEMKSSDESALWRGNLVQSGEVDIKFPVIMNQVGGRDLKDNAELFSSLFADGFNLCGRIQPIIAERYISSLRSSTSREVFFFEVHSNPLSSTEDRSEFNNLFSFYRHANRYAVVSLLPKEEPDSNSTMLFKDMYLLPIRPRDECPEFFDYFTHSIPAIRSTDVMIAVMVAHRDRRSSVDSTPSKPIAYSATNSPTGWDSFDIPRPSEDPWMENPSKAVPESPAPSQNLPSFSTPTTAILPPTLPPGFPLLPGMTPGGPIPADFLTFLGSQGLSLDSLPLGILNSPPAVNSTSAPSTSKSHPDRY